jgi:hypothetical protein
MDGLSHVPHDDRIAAVVLFFVLAMLLLEMGFSLRRGSVWGGRGGAAFRVERARHPCIYWTVMLIYSLTATGICLVEVALFGAR